MNYGTMALNSPKNEDQTICKCITTQTLFWSALMNSTFKWQQPSEYLNIKKIM